MNEDVMEKLDALFPDGYVIIHICKDCTIRMSLYNPHKDQTIEKYHQLLKENREGESE